MENVEKDVMKHKPRKQSESILGGGIGFNIIYQGILQGMAVVAMFILANNLYGHEVAATMGFLTLNFIQLIHMFSVRTNHSVFTTNPLKNKTLLLALFVGVGLLLAVALIPPVASIFHLQSLNITQWLIVLGFSVVILPFVEIVKLVKNLKNRKKD